MKRSILYLFFLVLALPVYSQLSWIRHAEFPGRERLGPASFAINGKGYCGLGVDTNLTGHSDWYEYDPVADSWTQKANFPSSGRWTGVYWVIGNKGYVVTGATNSGNSIELWEYDPTNDQWTAKADFPGLARQNAAGFAIGNKGYIGTGYSAGNSYNDFYEYDAVNDIWNQKAPFPGAARNGATGFSVGSKGYIGMGHNTNSINYFSDFYEYDPSSNTWTQKADYPFPSVNSTSSYSTSTDGYVLCGYYYQYTSITNNPVNLFYKFDPAINAWSLLGTFHLPRGYSGGFLLNNDIYITCGALKSDDTRSYKDLWKLANGGLLSVTNTGYNDVDFTIYPVPAGDNVFIDYPCDRRTLMKIYNVDGQLIEAININSQQLDVSDYPAGIYYVELITSDKKVLDSRFIKQ